MRGHLGSPADLDKIVSSKISCVMRDEDVVEILEAYDLLGSYRAAAEAVGCDHHTVRRYVRLRARAPAKSCWCPA
jgi:hypothetical protein